MPTSPYHHLGPNAALIGAPGSRWRLATPALVVDVGALTRNIRRLSDNFASAGLALRPHAKTHKCVEIARRQVAAGALGVCCATLHEAEVMAGAGIAGVLVTSPVVGKGKIERLARLNAESAGLMVVADNLANVAELDGAAAAAGEPLTVLVDVDVGMQRTGAATADAAVALARSIADAPHLAYGGVQGYSGRVQHIEAYADRAATYGDQLARLGETVQALRDAGLPPAIVTGGGTGTHAIDAGAGLFTEHQAGSYIFMDVEYNAVEMVEGSAVPFETALFVQCSVVSVNAEGFVTIDGGYKCFATDGPKPEVWSEAYPGAGYDRFGDEHGKLVLAPGANQKPGLGEPITLVTPHCDPTVNLHSYYHVVEGDTLIDIWPVDARGVL